MFAVRTADVTKIYLLFPTLMFALWAFFDVNSQYTRFHKNPKDSQRQTEIPHCALILYTLCNERININL
jgi:hypothetical protein